MRRNSRKDLVNHIREQIETDPEACANEKKLESVADKLVRGDEFPELDNARLKWGFAKKNLQDIKQIKKDALKAYHRAVEEYIKAIRVLRNAEDAYKKAIDKAFGHPR